MYIAHGYHADPYQHWFPWLKNALEIEGHDVKVIKFPNPDTPRVEEWIRAMNEQVQHLNHDTLFVAHSLGVITTLKFLNDADISSIGGVALVSGFKDRLPHMPELDAFVDQHIDYDALKIKLNHRFCIAAKNDTIVPFSYTAKLSDVLGAKLYVQEEGGHFCQEDGFESFNFLKQKIIQKLD
ncbi:MULTISPECIES: RBBP9/YdeN family alpha/beta hydrolase [Staphylococcus]|uniref:RBBP9/YdeN family alpha/beta hydrolase n=1 Tax=Staphylococcus TaxID=1279 RepID=UPI001F3ED0BE|nr:alpha/beta hydrolase [Staphylococcus agnetis]MCO4326435.1 alpha/beta hydrolase [Staphylococcus agnetis]MCO4369202.1 alpha/beta hydrolase [Staphylococcus agnetis]